MQSMSGMLARTFVSVRSTVLLGPMFVRYIQPVVALDARQLVNVGFGDVDVVM